MQHAAPMQRRTAAGQVSKTYRSNPHQLCWWFCLTKKGATAMHSTQLHRSQGPCAAHFALSQSSGATPPARPAHTVSFAVSSALTQPCRHRTSSPGPWQTRLPQLAPRAARAAPHGTHTRAASVVCDISPASHRGAPPARPARRRRRARLGRAVGGGALDLGPGRDDARRQLLLHKAAAVGVLAEVALRAWAGARASALCYRSTGIFTHTPGKCGRCQYTGTQ